MAIAPTYRGLSTDTKPPALFAGRTFYETDTGDIYESDGEGTWVHTASQREGGAAVLDTRRTPVAGSQFNLACGTATALTVPAGARVAFVQCEVQDVRWRDDGTNPTADAGFRLFADGDGWWYTGDLAAIRFIAATSGAVLNVAYYR